ncbi:alcohol dehydrogenase catalytic domain-containing protein, partial [Mycobacterium tuberculosis]|nr:alcohol dehydrogenase catalytic domain-containing protein [Mycobacterium tuberculosis]
PEALRLADWPEPSAGEATALVSVRAAGVNPVDALCRSGQASWVTPPFVPGYDAAGVVVEPDAQGRYRSGDRVALALTDGCYADTVAA